jgi:hypothetical protein
VLHIKGLICGTNPSNYRAIVSCLATS